MNHKLTVIAMDGYSVEPLTVDCVISSAGERYDVVMDATNDRNSSNSWLTLRIPIFSN